MADVESSIGGLVEVFVEIVERWTLPSLGRKLVFWDVGTRPELNVHSLYGECCWRKVVEFGAQSLQESGCRVAAARLHGQRV